jgi:hypothetical protein
MTTRTHTRQSYFVEQDGEEFEVSLPPVDGTETVTVSKDGKKADVRYLSDDSDAREDYWEDQDGVEFFSADPRSMYHRDIDNEELEEIFKENPGRVFLVSKYEHSLVRYYRQGTARNECRWDTSRGCAVLIVPEDVTYPEEYADAVLEEFSNWCNGDIYGCCRDTFEKRDDDTWKRVSEDACWGFIGRGYAETALKNGEF